MFKIVLKTNFLIKLSNTASLSTCYNYASLSLVKQTLFKPIQSSLNKHTIRFINDITVTSNKLTTKKKLTKKPKATRAQDDETSKPMFKVKAFATAVNYDLDGLKSALIQSAAYDVYEPGKLLPDNCLCVKSKYQGANEIEPRHVYFFEDGSVVFWNVSNEEQYSLLEMLNKYQETPYPINMVNDESEEMYFLRMSNHSNNASHGSESNAIYPYNNGNKLQTRLLHGNICFSDEHGTSNENHILEKYAFSDAISLSVKLGIWEKSLDEFAERVEFIADDLKRGQTVDLKIEQILKYLGELLTLRHSVNLHSNILAIPDFYWDRESLEYLYTQLYSHMSISKRTKLFNERLNHCVDLMQLVKQHLTDNKHTRLEWIIIGLIAIEVLIGLGVLDFLKKIALFVLNVNTSSPENK